MSSRMLLAGLLLVLSCSVKENRELCPCALSIELHHLPGPVTVQVVAGEHRASYTARNDTVMLVEAPQRKKTWKSPTATSARPSTCTRSWSTPSVILPEWRCS